MALNIVDVAHLLKRTEFFASEAKVNALMQLGTIEAVVNEIINRNVAQKPGWPQPAGFQDLHNYADSNTAWEFVHAARRGWVDAMAFGPAPLREKMTLFWHGHFCSASSSIADHYHALNQNQLFRDNAFGNFKDLAQKVSVDPMMLVFLNNNLNTKKVPNENFGRELLELFTLGMDNYGLIPGQSNVYSQNDVVSASKAWSGHGLDMNIDAFHPHATYKFRADQHFTDNKTFLGKTANFDGPDIIEHIFATNPYREISARFIATKLWAYFAYPDPEKAVVDNIISTYKNTLNIQDLLKAILVHPNFYSAKAKQGLISTPAEYIARLLQITGTRSNTDIASYIMWRMPDTGMTLFDPPNVAGWKNNDYWLSTSQMGARGTILNYFYYQEVSSKFVDLESMSSNDAVVTAARRLGLYELSPETKVNLVGFVNSSRAAKVSPDNRSRALFHLIIMSPDFQLS